VTVVPRPLAWPVAQPNDRNLVLCLPMDERGGIRALDRSGRRHNATLTRAFWGAGERSSALSFDGVSDYGLIDFTTLLAVMSRFTLSLRAVFTSTASIQNSDLVLFAQRDGAGVGRSWLLWRLIGNKIDSFLGGIHLAGLTTPSTNLEYEFALTWDGTTLRLYVNGVEEASRTGAVDEGATGSYVLGCHKGLATQFFPGRMRRALLYGRSLSPSEVKRLSESSPTQAMA